MHFLSRIYLLATFVLIALQIQAQHVSQLGRFSIEFQRGCEGVTVAVSTSPTFSGFTNSYFYEEGLLDVNDTFHIYTVPGIYEIVQLTQETISPKTDTLIFEVLPSTAPQFEIYECGTRTVQVEITEDIYDFYRVFFTPTDSVDYSPGDPFPTYTYPTDNVQILVEGIYNNSFPDCGTTFKSIVLNNSLPTSTIANAAMVQTCGTLFDITLSASVLPNVKYQVEISFNSGPFTEIYEGPVMSPLTIRNINNPGALDYCLRINTVEPCTNTITNGPEFCSTFPADQFEYLSTAYASYVGSQVAIVFQNQNFLDVLARNISSGSPVDTISSSTLFPSAGDNGYQLVLVDSCETTLDSILVRPPNLTATDRDYEENTISIAVTDPLNDLTETGRELVIYSEDSSIVVVLPFDEDIRLTPNIGSIQKIRVRYLYAEITDPVYSNEITTRFIYRIYVPTAFTPNNDGLNDRLQFFGLEGNTAEITIYNRWGQQIHFTENISLGWNGLTNGEPAPEGSYTYEIKFTSPDGEELRQVGTFALIIK